MDTTKLNVGSDNIQTAPVWDGRQRSSTDLKYKVDADTRTVSVWDEEYKAFINMSWECVEQLYWLIEEEKEAIKLEKLLKSLKEDEDVDLNVTQTTGRVLRRVIERNSGK